MKTSRKILFPIVSACIGVLLSFVLLEIILRFLPVSDSLLTMPVNASNPILRNKPNRDITWSRGHNFPIVSRKHINNQGFLNDQDYTKENQVPLLAIVGDSYVAAAQVANASSMHGILSEASKGKIRVYSFASSGSPLSSYLGYANYATREFDAAALTFVIIGNDFDESLPKYRTVKAGHFFRETPEGFELARQDYAPSLVKRLFRHSALVRYLFLNLQIEERFIERILRAGERQVEQEYVGNTKASFNEERISDSRKVVDKFFELLPAQTGLAPDKILFVIDGMRPHLYDPVTLGKASGSYVGVMRRYFKEVATTLGYEVIDMQPVFIAANEQEGARFEFPTDGHWNEVGHALVAKQIRNSAVYRSLTEP